VCLADAALHGQQPAAVSPCRHISCVSRCRPRQHASSVRFYTYGKFPLTKAVLKAAAVLLSIMLLCPVCCLTRQQDVNDPLGCCLVVLPRGVVERSAATNREVALHNPTSTFQCNTAAVTEQLLLTTKRQKLRCIHVNPLTSTPTRRTVLLLCGTSAWVLQLPLSASCPARKHS
jgi:hypothetical protein